MAEFSLTKKSRFPSLGRVVGDMDTSRLYSNLPEAHANPNGSANESACFGQLMASSTSTHACATFSRNLSPRGLTASRRSSGSLTSIHEQIRGFVRVRALSTHVLNNQNATKLFAILETDRHSRHPEPYFGTIPSMQEHLFRVGG